jgi:hypothetical protein
MMSHTLLLLDFYLTPPLSALQHLTSSLHSNLLLSSPLLSSPILSYPFFPSPPPIPPLSEYFPRCQSCSSRLEEENGRRAVAAVGAGEDADEEQASLDSFSLHAPLSSSVYPE